MTVLAQRPGTGVGGNFNTPTRVENPRQSSSHNNGSLNTDNPSDTTSQDQELKGIEHHEDIPDSVLLKSVFRFHFTPRAVKILSFSNPILDPTGAQFYDPLDAFNGNYYLSTGVIGQSHTPTFFTLDGNLGYSFMPSAQRVYRKTPYNVGLYQVQRPYTVLSYGGSINKDNQVHISHTQNITERWNVSMDYHLIRAEGVYANSGTKNQYLDLTTNYYSRDSRYQVQGGLIYQKAYLNENGGMTSDSIFRNEPSATLSGIPVVSYDATSLTKEFTLFAHQSFNTVRQVEWYHPIKETLLDTVSKTDSLGNVSIDVVQRDTILAFDTLHPHKPRVFNTGVFALDLQYGRFSRRYQDSVRFNQLSYNLYWTNDAYLDYNWHNPFKLTIGWKGSRAEAFMLTGEWRTISDFGPYLHTEIHPGFGTLDLHSELVGYANLAYSDVVPSNVGADLYARYLIPIDSLDRISICARRFVRPDIAMYMFRNGELDLTQFSATYMRDNLISIEFNANNINHMSITYLDDQSGLLSKYRSGNMMLYQARLNLYFKANWFHYDMQQLLQYSNSDEINLPLWTSKNSIYADFSLFHNALRTQMGFDVRYLTSFYADAYDPATGLFYRQTDEKIGDCIWADFFVNLQIKRATIYAKVGHWNALLEQNPNYFLLPHYADRRLGVFFGMTWKFFD